MNFLKSIKISVILAASLSGCASDDDFPLTNLVEARTFTVNTPPGWTLIEDLGIDSYVGRIAGRKDTIVFDQGFFCFQNLNDITENDRTLFFQKLEINGVLSVIHKERSLVDNGEVVSLSVYIDDNQRKNCLFVLDPVNEALILEICKSHQFK